MKKQLIPSTNPIKLYGATGQAGAGYFGNYNLPQGSDNSSGSGSSFSWNSFFSNLGGILSGAGQVVDAANSYDRTTTVNNNNTDTVNGHFSFTNGTTLTAIILGAIALIIVLVIVLGRKKD